MSDKMVKVNLDVQRMYRAKHEDRDAITVGPGTDIEVPAWVADEWAKPFPEPQAQVDSGVDLQTLQADIEQLKADVAYLRAERDKANAAAVEGTDTFQPKRKAKE